MDTQDKILKEFKKLVKLTDEANSQRESLLKRIENIEANIAHINEQLSYLTSYLTTQNTDDEVD
jgi:hypothetical protein